MDEYDKIGKFKLSRQQIVKIRLHHKSCLTDSKVTWRFFFETDLTGHEIDSSDIGSASSDGSCSDSSSRPKRTSKLSKKILKTPKSRKIPANKSTPKAVRKNLNL